MMMASNGDRWRVKLADSWERFNRVWSVLGVESPPLPDWDTSEQAPKKRKAEAGTSAPTRTLVKKVDQKSKALAPSKSSTSSLESSEDEANIHMGREFKALLTGDEESQMGAEVPTQDLAAPIAGDNLEQAATQNVLPGQEAPTVEEGRVETVDAQVSPSDEVIATIVVYLAADPSVRSPESQEDFE
ncbi:hypothetical protein GUJ93_ZPchr0005g16326 [Zizania palustris]|uniref:Uncharacterized protein n=1 Tax=Zizania palustris TaxID=103762 RepID=A0A8J5SMN4_ZIZPA|nr:hypothetical protein GUJ93_ZPchr0005g16326 [Zizania palustris]